jgi:YHS domain-containing protein
MLDELEYRMKRETFRCLSLAAALFFAGVAIAQEKPAAPATQPATAPAATVDAGNTICPVSKDKVGDSKIVEIYQGKEYHLCCPDCIAEFEKDPAKIAKAVADDPAKYGVK